VVNGIQFLQAPSGDKSLQDVHLPQRLLDHVINIVAVGLVQGVGSVQARIRCRRACAWAERDRAAQQNEAKCRNEISHSHFVVGRWCRSSCMSLTSSRLIDQWSPWVYEGTLFSSFGSLPNVALYCPLASNARSVFGIISDAWWTNSSAWRTSSIVAKPPCWRTVRRCVRSELLTFSLLLKLARSCRSFYHRHPKRIHLRKRTY